MGEIILWIMIAITAMVIDIITSNFFFVSFTCGGIAAIITIICRGDFNLQLIIFGSVSVVLMAITFSLSNKYLKKTVPKTLRMEETYVGREIVVNEDIIEKALFKIDGIYWTIKNQGGELAKGDKALIIGIEGNKMLITKKGE